MDLIIRFKNTFADFFLRILTILNAECSFLVSKPLKNVSCVETQSLTRRFQLPLGEGGLLRMPSA